MKLFSRAPNIMRRRAKYDPHADRDGRPLRYLFVASTGGHLAQLVRLSQTMNATPDSLWVSFDTNQSRSLLAGKQFEYVRYIRPRDWGSMIRTLPTAARILQHHHPDVVISTGAALALVFLPIAKWMRRETVYIESVSRVRGPSMTGRVLGAFRMARTFTQHEGWASSRWRLHPPVLANFRIVPSTRAPVERPFVFVTLGTIQPYRFDRLVRALVDSGMVSSTTVWQLGATTMTGLPGRVVDQVSAAEFDDLCRRADVVVTHAGVGTILGLLEAGVYPVVVPRRRAFGEHVDDHQLQITRLLSSLGIAEVVEADGDVGASIRSALQYRVVAGDVLHR